MLGAGAAVAASTGRAAGSTEGVFGRYAEAAPREFASRRAGAISAFGASGALEGEGDGAFGWMDVPGLRP